MEAADGQSNNAKVIIQFTDPSDLFKDVAPLLQNRLPLGNLHWKSPTRPLRSIEELDISLDREVKQTTDGGSTIRRHQIPGLRQTPFVKVLLLRCDDREKYKESARKEVKDWVKSLGFSTSGKGATSKQERHDAYEYLILHVVVPGTPAATQARSSKHISLEATESTDSVNSKSKWTGKSTSTIFDKLRADFSSSSKAPFERVAQIRLFDSGKPSTALSPLEVEQQWQDLIEKLKVAILQSFDVRVAQYEDDIHERESQRNLPGWNFCTFFILKEGLARGFENVGLLEDALQIYEELDLGLDVVIQDQAKSDTDATNVLLPYANDLKDTIRKVLEKKDSKDQPTLGLSLQAWVSTESSRFPWRLERREYQTMILTNQVSVLDFRIYMFIRQMQILLRQASLSLPAPRSTNSNRQSGPRWDADLLAEVCERSVRFMNLAARNLRQDLLAAWGGEEGLPEKEAKVQKIAIDNIVASWKWASLLQTLAECQIINSLSTLFTRVHGNIENGEIFSPQDIANSRVRADSTSTAVSEQSVNGIASDIFATLRIVKGSKIGLVFQAAELFTMLRTIFVHLCWRAGMLTFLHKGPHPEGAADADIAWTGILAPSLRAMLQSEKTALGAYKLFTVCACQCYTSANKPRASRQLLSDLANLEIHNQNTEAAVGWLDAIPGFLETPPGTWMERSILEVYIRCLREANRNVDLVKSLFLYIQSDRSGTRHSMQNMWEEMNAIAIHDAAIDLPFDAIFEMTHAETFITHHDTKDSSLLQLMLGVKVPIEDLGEVQAIVTCQSRSQHLPANLSFQYEGRLQVKDGQAAISLECATSTEGWYDLVSATLKVANITYKHDFRQAPVQDDEDTPKFMRQSPPPAIYLYPRNGSPKLDATHAAEVYLSAKRRILIGVDWGSNSITSAQLRLKPATAGLRLDLQSVSATSAEQALSVVRNEESYLLDFGEPQAESPSSFELVYSLDEPSTVSISIRAELVYTTEHGSFQLYDTLSLMVLLPISVNVQDIFQEHALYSRFTFSPSRLVPIVVTSCQLEGNGKLDILDGNTWSEGEVYAFPKQPVNWVVQMKERANGEPVKQERGKLLLDITYRCLDEIILSTIATSFRDEIRTTPYAYSLRPLQAHLRNKLQSLWTEPEIEMCALTGEVEMWDYDRLDWSSILHAFGKVEKQGLEIWLKSWHEKTYESPLKFQDTGVVSRVLRLEVDPPDTELVVTTNLQTLTTSYIVGQAIMAKAIVSAKPFGQMNASEDIEISLEIPSQSQSTSENWLIGGQRKASFRASTSKFEGRIILIPQRTGQLLLPGIEIRCRHIGERAGKPVTFETEHLSIATSLQVRSGIETTTVGIGDGERTEKHWLVNATKARQVG